MQKETISIHGGYDTDPTTKSVAVPIYQTVAYDLMMPNMALIYLI